MPTFTYLSSLPPQPRRHGRRLARETFDRLADHLLEQGSYTLRQLQRESTRNSQRIRVLLDSGLIQQSPDGQLRLTTRGLAACEERALLEIFRSVGPNGIGWHRTAGRGQGPVPLESTRPHLPGEPFGHLDLSATLSNARARGLPLLLREEDLVVHEAESGGRCASVVLLDLSGSMVRHGKFTAAKRAAIALRALVRRRFPGDELSTAGFATRAVPLAGAALVEAVPLDVGLFDPRQSSLRVARDALRIPEHFTNIQAGLRLARTWLRGKTHVSKQVLLITDGEPTAHLEGNDLVLAYPPTEETLRHTLEEARRAAGEGIQLSVFGLPEPVEKTGELSSQGLRPFVERLAWAGRGTALCCSALHLGRRLFERFAQSRSGRG
jgi:uncharacterized protein with von Willebrand factor type A (vWA) domain